MGKVLVLERNTKEGVEGRLPSLFLIFILIEGRF